MIYIIVIVMFFYFAVKIGNLERKITELGSRQKPADSPKPADSSVVQARVETPQPHSLAKTVAGSESPAVPVQPAVAAKSEVSLKKENEEIEFKLGSKVFTIVGAVAVMLGVGFFLRYAFEHNLINEETRVALAIIGGIILLGIGRFTMPKYRSYGEVLTGGGIGLFYLAVFAAHHFYALIAAPLAFFAIATVTAVSIAASLYYSSAGLAVFSLIAGFLAPLLFPVSLLHAQFIYVIFLDIVAVGIAIKKVWPTLSQISFAGTIIFYFVLIARFYNTELFSTFFLYSTIYFLTFLVVIFLAHFRGTDNDRRAMLALIVLNPLLYYSHNFVLIQGAHPGQEAALPLALGILYGFLSYGFFLVGKMREKSSLQNLASVIQLIISLAFFFLAVPAYFDHQMITILWAAEAFVMVGLGAVIRLKAARILGLFVFGAVLVRLFFVDFTFLKAAEAFVNTRFSTFVIASIFLAIASGIYIWMRSRREKDATNDDVGFGSEFTSAAAFIVFVIGATIELLEFYPGSSLTVFWSLAALVAGAAGFAIRLKAIRACSYILFIFASFRFIFFDSNLELATYTPVLNGRMLLLLGLLATLILMWATARAFRDNVDKEETSTLQNALLIAINIALFSTLSHEVADPINVKIQVLGNTGSADALIFYDNLKRALLSVAWLGYALVLLIVSIVAKSIGGRVLAIILFSIVILKVFIYDTANLDDLYRFISFISLGIILLVVGYLYYRFKERIRAFIAIPEGKPVSPAIEQ